jgi:hypothetical protein
MEESEAPGNTGKSAPSHIGAPYSVSTGPNMIGEFSELHTLRSVAS